jgi:NADPH:quinone reductase-like Zn-dependent oxidoreductase
MTSSNEAKMNAIIRYAYGNPSVLQFQKVPIPTPKPNQLLVKVKASSVNSADYRILTGTPWAMRLVFGLIKPITSVQILGADVAGVVEQKGDKCSQEFQIGDAVFGNLEGNFGCYAEYVCIDESLLVKKPENLSFEEAAALPLAGITALQGLRDTGKVKPGDHVVVNGAASGVGHIAVQIAKAMGAKVTAVVSSSSKLSMIQTLGADECVDASQRDISKEQDLKVDCFFDVSSDKPASTYMNLLNTNGAYVLVAGNMDELMKSVFNNRIKGLMAKTNKKDLQELSKLAAEMKIRPVVDKTFPLSKTAEAIQYLMDRKVKGKLVITVDEQ